MKSYTLKLIFPNTKDNDTEYVVIKVPDNVKKQDIIKILKANHDQLDYDYGTDYDIKGRSPITLVNHICKKNGWEWEKFNFDECIIFD